MNQYEREEDQLERDLKEGRITSAEYNKQLQQLHRDMDDELRGTAEDAATHAYNDVYNRW